MTQQKFSETINNYRKAAQKGYPAAQYDLGLLYIKGDGVEKDEEVAVKWFKKAAEQGYPAAQYTLGLCFRVGMGVEQDEEEAVTWFAEAAQQEHGGAQYALGMHYFKGDGELDDEEAVKWFIKAAEQGHAGAQFDLGYCFRNGRGIEQDDEEAFKWFAEAAQQGHADAQHVLGLCYEDGQGVEQDEEEAAKWHSEAAKNGYRPPEPSDFADTAEFIRNIVITKELIDKYFANTSQNRIYIGSDIPADKVANAIKSYAPNLQFGEVLLFVDDTVFRGAKEGLILTDTHIYAKSIGAKPSSISFKEIKNISRLKKSIMINGNKFTEAIQLDHDKIDSLILLIIDICNGINSLNSENSDT